MAVRSSVLKVVDLVAAISGTVFLTVVAAMVVHNLYGHVPRPVAVVVNDGPAAIAAIVLVSMWGWWRKVGWKAPNPDGIIVLWFPGLLLIPSIYRWHLLHATPAKLVFAALAVLMIGFTEEVWFRGIVLAAVRDRGPRLAAVVSALAFGGLHLINLRVLNARYVALQMVQAFALGLVFAAVRIRLDSLFPVIVMHAMFDFGFIAGDNGLLGATRLPSLRTQLPLVAISALYMVVTLRRSKAPKTTQPNRCVIGAIGGGDGCTGIST